MKTIFLRGTFVVFFLFFISLLPTSSFGEIQTFTHEVKQSFAGSQSPDDARIAAIQKAKREVLEMAGTYLESMTVVKDNMVDKDEILALAAGVLKTEIVGEPKPFVEGNVFGIIVIAKVDVDTSILDQRVSKLLNDRPLLEQYKESQNREKELLERIKALEEQNSKLKGTASDKQKEEFRKEYNKAAKGITAVELLKKASVLWRSGAVADYTKSMEYINQAIKIDPDYSDAYSSLGYVYKSKGDKDRAIENYNKALAIDLKKRDAEHPVVARRYSNLGVMYFYKHDYDRAIEYLNKVLPIQLEKLGPEHRDVADTYNRIGLVYGDKGDYDLSIEYLNKALKNTLKRVGPKHPFVATVYGNLGQEYRRKGDYDRAIDYHNKALEIHANKLGPEHPMVAWDYNNLGNCP